MYIDNKGRRMTLEEALVFSLSFVVLVTRNYLDDIKRKDIRVLAEIDRAKTCRTPVILLMFEDLKETDKQEAKEIFKEHNVIKIFEDVPWMKKNSKQN